MHDCLDKTREGLTEKLGEMYNASCSQHEALAKEIAELKMQRDKWIWWAAGALATDVIEGIVETTDPSLPVMELKPRNAVITRRSERAALDDF